MSLVESVANVFVGYGEPVVTKILIVPAFGRHATLAQDLQLGPAFSGVSTTKIYVLQRLFERQC